MLNKKTFEEMRKYLEGFDKMRETIIAQSRIALKNSKKAIYSAHRGELENARKLLADAKKTIGTIADLLKKDIKLAEVGAYTDALEEYTEAACYVHYLEHKTLPSPTSLGIDVDTYLCALSDVIGELVRKAINSSIAGDHEGALAIKDFVQNLYSELMLFDFRNTPVRKKFDAIKYGLEKLEDLALKIKMKS